MLPILYPDYAKAPASQRKAIELEFNKLKDRSYYREKFTQERETKAKEERYAKKVEKRKKQEKRAAITKYAELDPAELEPGQQYGLLFDPEKQQQYFDEIKQESLDAAQKLAATMAGDAVSYDQSAIDAAKSITNVLKKNPRATRNTYLGIGKKAMGKKSIGGAMRTATGAATVSDIVGLPPQNPVTLEVGQLPTTTRVKLDVTEADKALQAAGPSIKPFGVRGRKGAGQTALGATLLADAPPQPAPVAARPTRSLPAALSPWTTHLGKYRAAHADMSLRQCMQEAKKTYKK